MNYSFDDLINVYEGVGVKRGRTVFIESDLACLGLYEVNDFDRIVSDHYMALRELVGYEGTIVVPTFSTYLCNSDTPYDSMQTRSEMGMLSEYIRQLPGAVRSYHAFTSYAAVGLEAQGLCQNVSYLAYGPESVMDRMIERDSLFVSIGLQPHDTCSTVHQTEMVMGAPYRYIKEFQHAVVTDSGLMDQFFYMHVRYQTSNINKDKRSLFRSFEEENIVMAKPLGRGIVYAYSMADFYRHSISYFMQNPYAILACEPAHKPYAQTI